MTGEGKKGTERTRREFLATSTALAGAAMVALAARSGRGQATPQTRRHAALRYARRFRRPRYPSQLHLLRVAAVGRADRWSARLRCQDGSGRGHRDGMGRLGRPEDLDFQVASRRRVPQRRDDRRRGDQVEHRAHPRSQDRSFLHPLGVDGRRARHGRRQAHGALPSQGRERGLRHQSRLLPRQPHGAGFGRQGRHQPGELRAIQVQVVEALRHLRAGALREFLGDRRRGQHAALSRRHDRQAQEGGSRSVDRAADQRGRPDRQCRLRRRAELHQGAWRLVQHLAGAAGRDGVHRLQPQERAVLGKGQPRRPSAAHGGGARDRPPGHPRSGVQQAGLDRQGVLQRGQSVARQGHRVVAAIRSRQGQGDAQEGQRRRRQAADHRQRQLPLHAAIRRAGARDAQGSRVST